jgi:endoplasmic reticulum resident protein 44
LPLIAIDSFRHMYLFPNFKDMYTPGKLKQFLADLYSGKLHRWVSHCLRSLSSLTLDIRREFHYGPDEPKKEEENHHAQHIDHHKKATQPPESTFKKLGPSNQRYTILSRDEL